MNNLILTGDCSEVIRELIVQGVKVNGVITSPPYNLGKNPNHRKKSATDYSFYSAYEDARNPEEYIEHIVNLFKLFEDIIIPEGVIVFNMSFSVRDASLPYRLLVRVQDETAWENRDTVYWKKPSSMCFQTSGQNMSRIVEPIFIFARVKKFTTNRLVSKINEKTGQKFYHRLDNFIEAPNYDPGTRKIHKATFSCGLVEALLYRYFPKGSLVLDPFAGIGTTGIACINNDRHYILIEIDPTYTAYAKEKLIPRPRFIIESS